MLSKINFLLRLIIAIILLQSLYFKFTGHAEAKHIFNTLGAEPWGRIILGCIELFVGITLLLPKTKFRATLVAAGLMVGALGAHLFTPLGVVIRWEGNSDNGELFIMALIALVLSIISLILHAKIKKIIH
ncbi:MAG: DoxX family protein [Flavobacteriaceae bacterium]